MLTVKLIRSGNIHPPCNHNLYLVERYVSEDKSLVLVYLAGTGIRGTVGAVAYLKEHLRKIHKHEKGDFAIVKQIPRRDESEDITKQKEEDLAEHVDYDVALYYRGTRKKRPKITVK